MKKIKESIKYYDKFNPYLKYILLVMTFFVFIKEQYVFMLLSLVAVALIIGFDFLNRQYSSLIMDNKIYQLGALYMYNGILLVGLFKVIYEAIKALPLIFNHTDDGYMLYELSSTLFNIGFMIFLGSAVIVSYYYIMHGTLHLNQKLKYFKETNMLTDLLVSKFMIAFGICVSVLVFYNMFQGAAQSIMYQITNYRLDAFNIISRNEQTIYTYNYVVDLLVSMVILLTVARLNVKMFNGKNIKTELGIIIYMLFIYLNLGMLQVNGDGTIATSISEGLSIIINTIVFSQIFNYLANQFDFNDKLFTVKLPILVIFLSVVAYWHFILGGLALLVCMNFKYNIIQKIKEA